MSKPKYHYQRYGGLYLIEEMNGLLSLYFLHVLLPTDPWGHNKEPNIYKHNNYKRWRHCPNIMGFEVASAAVNKFFSITTTTKTIITTTTKTIITKEQAVIKQVVWSIYLKVFFWRELFHLKNNRHDKMHHISSCNHYKTPTIINVWYYNACVISALIHSACKITGCWLFKHMCNIKRNCSSHFIH